VTLFDVVVVYEEVWGKEDGVRGGLSHTSAVLSQPHFG
jgi:hypothetical protein